jgi:hypothetical protein
MKAVELLRKRIILAEDAFADVMIWQLPQPLAGSPHDKKYRMAYVVANECVLRYDNEAGKGDHRHVGGKELVYRFTTIEKLLADFQKDIARWNDENRNA